MLFKFTLPDLIGYFERYGGTAAEEVFTVEGEAVCDRLNLDWDAMFEAHAKCRKAEEILNNCWLV